MLSCKETTELLSDSLEAQLPLVQRWAMKMHLVICANCRRYRRHLLFMHKILGAQKQLRMLPEQARLRIKEKLEESIRSPRI